MINIKELNKIIDHTNVKPDATEEDIKKLCGEAKQYGFRGACVDRKWVKLTAKELKGTGIKTVCLIDPPIGDSPHNKRVQLCKKAKKDGADETDVVIPIPLVKHGKWTEILKDLKALCGILPTKIIIGSGYLTDEEIAKASELAKKAGAFCVKTATLKDPLKNLGEKASHLKIMREAAPGLLIKASGGIKTFEDAEKMLKAGADIIGTSSGAEIIKVKNLKRKA